MEEENVIDIMMTSVLYCTDKSAAEPVSDLVSVITDIGTDGRHDDNDAFVSVIPSQSLLQYQTQSRVEFNTVSVHEGEDCEQLTDSDITSSLCTGCADESQVSVELFQTETVVRLCTHTMQQSVPTTDEPPTSEIDPVPEQENAVGSEVLYEFSLAECSCRPQASVPEDICVFDEGTTDPEIQQLMEENVGEPSEIADCLEKAELHETRGSECTEQLMTTDEELIDGDVEGLPETERLEGCEIASELVEAELKDKISSETGVMDWCLESDEVDDLFEMAYEGQLSPEEIPSETDVLETKIQLECGTLSQLVPDVYDGAVEEISSTMEMEDMATSCEVVAEMVHIECTWLEASHALGQEVTVADEGTEVKEMTDKLDEINATPDEVLSPCVMAEIATLLTMNTVQLESQPEDDHGLEVLPEHETLVVSCGEIIDEFLSASSVTVNLPHCVSDGVTELNVEDQYADDIAVVDEEKSAEPEEISSCLATTSLVPRAQYLTSELVGESPALDDIANNDIGEVGVESVACEVVENQTCESGSLKDLPQSHTTPVMEEILTEEFDDFPADITRCNFVTEDAESVPGTSELLPIGMVSAAEFVTSCLVKVEHRTPLRHLSITEDHPCREIDTAMSLVDEAVVSDVTSELDTVQTKVEPEVFELYVEEEEMVVEKITETVVSTRMVQGEGRNITVQGG